MSCRRFIPWDTSATRRKVPAGRAVPQALRLHFEGNNLPLASVEQVVRRSATLIGVAVLSLVGCEGGDDTTSIERNTTTIVVAPGPPKEVLTREERVSHWIRSCEVREILFTHENVAHIRFRDGERRRVRLGDDATADRVFATASAQPCPDFKIIVAIE